MDTHANPNPSQPPRLATALLRRLVTHRRLPEYEDDLADLFVYHVARHGAADARRRYWRGVFGICLRRSLRHDASSSTHSIARGPIMWSNYLKVGLRHLRRQAGYAAINIGGLAVGVACCILMALYVQNEWSYDRFHEASDRLYRAWVLEEYGENERFHNTLTPMPLAAALEEDFPEVEAAVRIDAGMGMVERDDETFQQSIHIVDPDFFEVFSFLLLEGDPAQVLQTPEHAVITASTAEKYFGAEDPMGEPIRLRRGDVMETYIVAGLAEDVPPNSSIQFEVVIPYRDSFYGEQARSSWFNVMHETYVLIAEGQSVEALEAKLPALSERILGDDYEPGVYTVGVQPMTEIHLDNTMPAGLIPPADPVYSYILGGLAVLVLLIACINFMTMAIGRSASRALEVGVRKVIGAQRPQLMGQFWGEALLMSVVALSIGLVLAWLVLPVFNDLAGRSLRFSATVGAAVFFVGLALTIGIVAGSYPALVLSSFRPIDVLKGRLKIANRSVFQRGLTVLQFSMSIFLLIGALGMQRQLHFLQETTLGFDEEQAVVLATGENGPTGRQLADRYRQALASEPGVVEVAASSFSIGDGWGEIGYTDDRGVYREFVFNVVSPEYVQTLELEVVAGRDFQREGTSDATRSILINETMAEAYGWENPVGMRLPGEGFLDHEIIGVVKDFHYASLRQDIRPLVLTMNRDMLFAGAENVGFASSPSPEVTVRLAAGDVRSALAVLEREWNAALPGRAFDYVFLDDAVDSQYREEERLSTMIELGTLLSIVIACLGLFGLVTLTTVRRTKEIGVRKVLGATVPGLTLMLSREFALLVGLAFLIAAPVAYLALQIWLQDFAYRATLSPLLFLGAGLLALAIALATISAQTIKAALTNPVHALRYE